MDLIHSRDTGFLAGCVRAISRPPATAVARPKGTRFFALASWRTAVLGVSTKKISTFSACSGGIPPGEAIASVLAVGPFHVVIGVCLLNRTEEYKTRVNYSTSSTPRLGARLCGGWTAGAPMTLQPRRSPA